MTQTDRMARWTTAVALVAILGSPDSGRGAEPAPTRKSSVPGVRVVYETRGVFPGRDAGGLGARDEVRTLRQTITVDDSGGRLVLLEEEPAKPAPERTAEAGAKPAPGAAPPPPEYVATRKLVLRMDREPPVIWEVIDPQRYLEHEGDLNDLQKQRRIAEQNELELVKKMTKKDRDEYFRRNPHLRPDGSREVKVTREPGKTILGRACEHVRILENDREILDLQVAPEGTGARSYFHLYRRLGAFSEEALEKIKDLQGIPLEGRLTIVTALPTQTWEVEAKSVEAVELDPKATFDLPPEAKRVDEEPAEYTCAWRQCGKRFDPPPKGMLDLGNGVRLYFCSEEHVEEYIAEQEGGTPPGEAPKER